MKAVEIFFEAVAQNPTLAQELQACTSFDQASSLAKANGHEVSSQEIATYLQEAQMLSDEDVANIDGGFHPTTLSTSGIMTSKPGISSRLGQLGINLG